MVLMEFQLRALAKDIAYLGGGAEVYGRIENVTDEDYEEVPTYNTGGAAGYVGFRYSF